MPRSSLIWLSAILAIPAVAAAFLLADGGQQPGRKTPVAQPAARPAADPKTTRAVRAAVNDAIGVLEGPDYRQFMEHYAPVSVLQGVRRRKGGVTDFARRAGRDKTAAAHFKSVLDRLRKARKVQPTFNGEKTIATFTFVLEPARTVTASEFPFGKTPKEKIAVKGYAGDLATAIDSALAALKGGDLEDYLAHMLPVTDLQTEDVATVAKRLKASPHTVKAMIADLTAIAKQTPKYEQQGTVAVVTVPTPQTPEKGRMKGVVLPDRVFKFQKVGGHWRLYDNTRAMRAAVKNVRRTIPAVTDSLVMEKFRDHWRLSFKDRDSAMSWYELMFRLRPRSKAEKTKTH